MPDKRWMLGVVLAVPLVAGVTAVGLRLRVDGEIRAAARQLAEIGAMRAATASAGELCGQAAPELAAVCARYDSLWYLGGTAVLAALAGVGLLVMINLAGRVAGRSAAVLLNTFRPGLYLTAVGVIGLIAVHAGLAVATLYYAEGLLTGRVHTGLLVAIGLGAVAGIVAVARSTFSVVRPAETTVVGTRLDRDKGDRLYRRIEALADALGALRPAHVVVGLDPNFFVTEAKVTCLNGVLTGRTLYCSLPLARILSRAELDAVIGH